MADSLPISELLASVRSGDSSAAGPIVEHYWEAANRAILRRLSPSVRRYVAGSDIANAALRSALSHVGGPDSRVQDRDDFWHLLLAIIHRKAASAARHAGAEQRDVRRTVEYADQGVGKTDGPLEHLIAEDLGERVATLLLEEPDEPRQLVSVLGIHDERSASEIRLALAERFPDIKPPAVRTIQSWLCATRERLRVELGKDLSDE